MGGFAWVTLATNDSYSLGALVLAHSLRRVGTQHDLVILITPGVTETMREKLSSVFNLVREVNVLDSKDESNLAILARPELGITFTKLHCWRLTQYEKCVFIDADALVVRNCDELFEREELSAAPDVGWPDCFNSGVFVFKPSQQTFTSLTSFAASQGSFDGADQGLLNSYFSDWAHKDISKHLPFIYNMCSTATYSYAPAFKQYGENVRIVHFIGSTKPWMQYFNTLTGIAEPPPGCNHLQPLLQIWWNIFCDNVHPHLSDVMAASTMTSIWHDPVTFPSYPIPPFKIVNVYSPDKDMLAKEQLETLHFSEFKDPWENYSQREDPFFKDKQQTDIRNQYYLEPNKSSNYSSEVASHDQCGVDLPLLSLSSSLSESSCQVNDHDIDHCSLHTNKNLQESRQENFSLQNELNQEFMEYNYATQRIYEQEYSSDADSKYLIAHMHEINSLCDFIERVHSEPDDHNHYTSYQNHSTVQSIVTDYDDDQIVHNISEPDPSMASTLNNIRQTNQNFHNSKTTDLHIPNPSCIPATCTNPDKVETQTTFNASPCVESLNGGMAGALSKLTIGEERSDEQRAIEDFVRKQNWEQGNIDYMGRDSFDNILKKINETLSSAPSLQPSPAKETRQPKKSSSKSSEVEAAVEKSEVALSVLAPEDQSESLYQELPKDMCQENSKVISCPKNYEQISKTDPSLETTHCQILQEKVEATPTKFLTNIICDNAIENIQIEIKTTQKSINETEVPPITIKTEDIQEVKDHIVEVYFDVAGVETQDETITATSITTAEAPETLISSGVIIDCPVPIQVAESVLQIESKESVTEEPKSENESINLPLTPLMQESTTIVAETVIKPNKEKSRESHKNSEQFNKPTPRQQLSDQDNSQAYSELESDNISSEIGRNDSVYDITMEKPEDSIDIKSKLTVKLPQNELVSNESADFASNLIHYSTAEPTECVSPAPMNFSTLEMQTSTKEGPVRPVRSKDLKIPGTPIVIGPTPPTSPPLEVLLAEADSVATSKHVATSVQAQAAMKVQSEMPEESLSSTEPQADTLLKISQESQVKSQQAITKMVKKSSVESDSPSSPESESSGKKPTKKVVKKVTKKSKEEEGEESSSVEKTKKVVKKKVLKTSSSTSFETETTVPETPPPTIGSDIPIPPKRKTKSMKFAEKKSD